MRIEELVLQYYAAGEFAGIKPGDVPECGDGLLKFLLTELSRKEDCDSLEEAVRRLDTAIRELSELRTALLVYLQEHLK